MTAVEWLREKLWKEFNFSFSDNILEQAKEMEKEHIMNAWAKGVTSENNATAEQYYNETFKKD